MRRMKYTNRTNVILKDGVGNVRTITQSNISYMQRNPLRPIKLNVWAKFDEINFDGISVLANLNDDLTNKSIGSCEVIVYAIDQGNSWNETLIGTKTGTATANGVIIDFDASELPSIQGDVTLKLSVRATRLGKTYYHTGYFNHLGSLEVMTKNKKKIAFMEITKRDE